jgi:hypothetical protein
MILMMPLKGNWKKSGASKLSLYSFPIRKIDHLITFDG